MRTVQSFLEMAWLGGIGKSSEFKTMWVVISKDNVMTPSSRIFLSLLSIHDSLAPLTAFSPSDNILQTHFLVG